MATAEPPSRSNDTTGSTATAEHPLDQWLKQAVGGLITASVAAWVTCFTKPEWAGLISAILVLAGCGVIVWTFLHERKSYKSKFFRTIGLIPLVLGLVSFVVWRDSRPSAGTSPSASMTISQDSSPAPSPTPNQTGQTMQTMGATSVQRDAPKMSSKFFVSIPESTSDASGDNYIATAGRLFRAKLVAENLDDDNGSEIDLSLTNVQIDGDLDSSSVNVQASATISATMKSPNKGLLKRSAHGTGKTPDEAVAVAIGRAAQEIVDQLETTERNNR